ncbi:MAG: flagellar protein FlaG [Candidatus Hinthialibacter antarcticus]|nr:flagellar protein FlaG [Candidatus Hinthialibacter antarcticus]
MNVEPIKPNLDHVFTLSALHEEPLHSSRFSLETPTVEKSEPAAEPADKPVNRIEAASGLADHRVNFRFDEGSGRTIIRVVDSKTHEVLQEFPRNQILEITERMKSIMGVFFDREV